MHADDSLLHGARQPGAAAVVGALLALAGLLPTPSLAQAPINERPDTASEVRYENYRPVTNEMQANVAQLRRGFRSSERT
jgi:hypothetical protein